MKSMHVLRIFVNALVAIVILAGCAQATPTQAPAPAPAETQAPAAPAQTEAPAAPAQTEAPAAPAKTEAPAATQAPAEQITLHINWFAWAPADQLSVLVKDYTAANPNVKVVVDTVPAAQWYDKTFTEFASGKTSFDIAFSDSQWIGQLAVSGYAVELTD